MDVNNSNSQKSCFMTNAAKEIKTHLQTIKSYNEILQDTLYGIKGDLPVKYLKKMTEQIDKVTKIVNDFGDTFQLENNNFHLDTQELEFDPLVKLAILSVKQDILNKIIITGETGLKVKADSAKIIKVIKCLLVNAAQHSKQTDHIYVNLNVSKSNHVVLCVEDFGTGIKKTKQKNIFERKDVSKKVLDERYPGLGVGLYISRAIIEKHDGHIWVDSSLNKGSKFYFSIPVI